MGISAEVHVQNYIKDNRGSHYCPDSMLLDMLLAAGSLGMDADGLFEEFPPTYARLWWESEGDASAVLKQMDGFGNGFYEVIKRSRAAHRAEFLPSGRRRPRRPTRAERLRGEISKNRDSIYRHLADQALPSLPKCTGCGAIDNLTIDHKVPLSREGTNDMENLQLLCHSCNASKGTKTMDEWLAWKGSRPVGDAAQGGVS